MILKRYFNFQKELCLKEQRKCTTKMKHTLWKLIRNGIMVNDLLIIKYKKQTGFFFLKLGFTPCKAEQPLRGKELQENEAQKKITAYRKSV